MFVQQLRLSESVNMNQNYPGKSEGSSAMQVEIVDSEDGV
jgi:hypothetical protein